MNLTVEMDTKALEAAFDRAPTLVKGNINAWIYKTALRTEKSAKHHIVPNVDTGQLQSSVHVRVGNMNAVVSPTVKHAIFIHRGRKPGKMPPYGEGTSLGSWARRKGIPAFLVARSIGRKGTKANPFMDKAYREVKPHADRDAQALLDNIIRGI